MRKIEKATKESENFYYKNLEWYRVFGADIDRIENELSAQLGRSINFSLMYPDKKLMYHIFGSNLSATEVYSALEVLSDDISTKKNPEHNEVEFVAKVKDFEVKLTLVLNQNQRCWYEEVGTKEVPAYKLRCEEN
jgi:hypothetical protein